MIMESQVIHRHIRRIQDARDKQKADIEGQSRVAQVQQKAIESFHAPLIDSFKGSRDKVVTEIAEEILKELSSHISSNQAIALPSEVIEPISEPVQASINSNQQQAQAQSDMTINPDKDIDMEILKELELPTPSALIKQIKSMTHTEQMQQLNRILEFTQKISKQMGGRMHSMLKSSPDYLRLSEQTKGLKLYRDRLRDVAKALLLSGTSRNRDQLGKGAAKRYALTRSRDLLGKGVRSYFASPDEMVDRLETLCGSIDVGNTSHELKNEVMDIIDSLLNLGVIDKDLHRVYYDRWLK